MADDDRAAKAARAKALVGARLFEVNLDTQCVLTWLNTVIQLKKRQQQKKGEATTSSSGTHSPGASISRASTPVLATRVAGGGYDDAGAMYVPLRMVRLRVVHSR